MLLRRLAIRCLATLPLMAACAAPGAPSFTEAELAVLATLRYDDGALAPVDPSNRVSDDPAARAFGQRLFFDRRLSGPLIDGDNDGSDGTLGRIGEAGRASCADCHVPEDGFVDTRSPHRQVSLAAQWTLRRTPTLLEIGFAPVYNWDGRRDSLWGQAMGVLESERELNGGRLFVAQQIALHHRAEYEAIFGPMPELDPARFPTLTPEDAGCTLRRTTDGPVYDCRGRPGDGADYDAMAPEDQAIVTRIAVDVTKAMGAYQAQLRCGPGRFDAWLDGDELALSDRELRGAALFVGRGGCVECHSGPRLTDDRFHNVGIAPAIVAVVIQDIDDRGAAEGIAMLEGDPLSTRGEYSDGPRELPTATGPELEGAFRTPTLRCVSARPSFMHTGQLRSLEQVVAFFDRGGDPAAGYPGESEIHRLDLTEEERADLVAFMGTLDGPGPDPSLLAAPE